MSDTHTITDEQILAAWGGADGMDAERRAETADELRGLVESPIEGASIVGVCTVHSDGDPVDVTALRDRLGGWAAVWRAVLADEGFEPVRGRTAWELALPRAELLADIGPDGWELWIARWKDCIPLRSPADLRVRVGHAKGLFGEGTR